MQPANNQKEDGVSKQGDDDENVNDITILVMENVCRAYHTQVGLIKLSLGWAFALFRRTQCSLAAAGPPTLL
jgi:hypothetical protein